MVDLSPRQPENPNLLYGNRYKMTFLKLPNVAFFTQTFTFPGVSLGETMHPTPWRDMPIPGEKLIYEPLVLNFLLDEDLANYLSVHDWLREIGAPDDVENRFTKTDDLTSTMSLFFLTNAGVPNKKFNFYGCFPTNVSSVPLNYTDGQTPAFADITLAYSYFKLSD